MKEEFIEIFVVVRVAETLRATKRYLTFAEANTEAMRLSEAQPNDVFMVLQRVAVVANGRRVDADNFALEGDA